MEHGFTWISAMGLGSVDHVVMAFLVSGVLIVWGIVAARQVEAAGDPVIPDATLTARNALEIFVELFRGVVDGVLGDRGRQYFPVYASFFLFILFGNLTGLIPGFLPPTGNFNVTLGLGIASFLLYNYIGFREHGVGYLKHFVGPIWWLAFLMIPLEIIDNLVRPVSLALRLFGNMNGDHMVLEIFTDMTKLIIPVVFYGLGTFISLIQAFVFTLLSLVYVSLALGGHGDEHH